jgi:hypothetical protein
MLPAQPVDPISTKLASKVVKKVGVASVVEKNNDLVLKIFDQGRLVPSVHVTE